MRPFSQRGEARWGEGGDRKEGAGVGFDLYLN